MRPRINIISLGVRDLIRSIAFYRDGLGFALHGVPEGDDLERAVASFNLEDNTQLNLWSYGFMAADTGEPVGGVPSVTLGHVTTSPEEVDTVMVQARAAGARIVRDPLWLDWGGYSGYFADPDGHLWEPVWLPSHPDFWTDGQLAGPHPVIPSQAPR